MLRDLKFPALERIQADPQGVLTAWYAQTMAQRHPLSKDMPFIGTKPIGVVLPECVVPHPSPIACADRAPVCAEPEVCLAFIAAYLVIVWLGNKVMAHREPFQLRPFQLFHNVFQIGFSTYIFYEVLRTAWVLGYKMTCNAVDEVHGKDMAWAVWCFQLAKIFDFNDTFILVLKKKKRQISFLHVYTTTPPSTRSG